MEWSTPTRATEFRLIGRDRKTVKEGRRLSFKTHECTLENNLFIEKRSLRSRRATAREDVRK